MAAVFAAVFPCHAEKPRVTTLHPLLADLATRVGGDRITVSCLIKPGQNPHAFEPTASDMRDLAQARIVLASGKGLEPYLSRLRDNLTNNQTLVDLGESIPSLETDSHAHDSEQENAEHDHGEHEHAEHGEHDHAGHDHHDHDHGPIDPHWWHSIDNMKRAANTLARELGKMDPEGKQAYKESAKAYRKNLQALKKWAKKEISRIPPAHRKLATSHSAFNYFCEEFDFESIAVRGLAPDQESSARKLSDVIKFIKAENVKAVFPEQGLNPKVLREIVRETGAHVGKPLIADGVDSKGSISFERMIKHNVTVIVEALTQ